MTAENLEKADNFLLMIKEQIDEFLVDTPLAELLKRIQNIFMRKDSIYPSSIYIAMAIISFIYYIRGSDNVRSDHQLLVDCMNAESYISEDTRQKILDTLLTVPTVS